MGEMKMNKILFKTCGNNDKPLIECPPGGGNENTIIQNKSHMFLRLFFLQEFVAHNKQNDSKMMKPMEIFSCQASWQLWNLTWIHHQ